MKATARFVMLACLSAAGFGFGIWCAGPSRALLPAVLPLDERATFAERANAGRDLEDVCAAVFPAGREDDPLARCGVLSEALDGVTEAQAIPLLERLDHLPSTDRDRLLAPVFARLCALFPATATEWVQRLPQSHDGWFFAHDPYARVRCAWARLVPDAALAAAQKSPRCFAYAYAARTSTSDDPSEPETIGFDSLPPGPLRERAAALFVTDSGYEDVADAWRVLQAEVHGGQRIETAWHLVDRGLMRSERAPALLKVLEELAPELPAGLSGHSLLNQMAPRFIHCIEPEDVADWTLRLPEAVREPTTIAVLSEWFRKAPVDDALNWAWENAVPLDRGSGDGSVSALEVAYEAAPDATLEWLAHLPPCSARDRLLAHAFADGTMPDFRQDELREKMGLAVKP